MIENHSSTIKVTCVYGDKPEPPYIDLHHTNERITLSYETSAALLGFMKRSGAMLRSDETFVLTDSGDKFLPAQP